jgi:hypothetical protein
MAKNNNEYMKNYMKKYWDKTKHCDTCDKDIKAGGFFKHVKTSTHLRKANKLKPDEVSDLTSKIDALQRTINELASARNGTEKMS